ncbi:hypothetical protein CCH79_00009756, partial [Gambusia affinis]
MDQPQSYSSHPDRFGDLFQVLSKESLTGCCYWEVEKTETGVHLAVACKNISRTGMESRFGCNDKSWALYCHQNAYYFWHNSISTFISGPVSSRVGVFLNHRAGFLSFYSVSESMTLLHRVQTRFTQPLLVGLRFFNCKKMASSYIKHDEVMKMFCRTDQNLCLLDEHKGHDTVSAAAGRPERQRELEERRGNIQQRIQDREKDVKLLLQEVEAINHSADKTVEDSEKIFTELIRFLQERSSEVKQQIRTFLLQGNSSTNCSTVQPETK